LAGYDVPIDLPDFYEVLLDWAAELVVELFIINPFFGTP